MNTDNIQTTSLPLLKAVLSSLAATTLLVSSGCAIGSSAGVATHEISAVLRVVGDGSSNVRCEASFYHGGGLGGTSLELTEGDDVLCSDGSGSPQPMLKEQDIFGVRYKLSRPYIAGRTYQITFQRGSGTGSNGETLVSSITVPAPINISAPLVGSTIPKGDNIPVSWNAITSTDPFQLQFSWSSQAQSGSVSASRSFSARDRDGNYVISGSETRPVDSNGNAITGDLNGSVRLTRSRRAKHPEPLLGTSEGIQERSVSFLLKE